MLDMRMRVQHWMAKRGITAYQLAKASGGRISMRAAYRLASDEDTRDWVELKVLDALCDVLRVSPNQLLEREPMETAQ